MIQYQAVILQQGFAFVTSGTFNNPSGFHCHADGGATVTWLDGSTQNITAVAGDAFPIRCKSIEITSGTWSINQD